MRLHWITRLGAAATLALASSFVVAGGTGAASAATLPLPALPPLTVPAAIGGLLGSTPTTLPAAPVSSPVASPVTIPAVGGSVPLPSSTSVTVPAPLAGVTGPLPTLNVGGNGTVSVGADPTTTTTTGSGSTTTTTTGSGSTTSTTTGSGSTTSTTTAGSGGSTTSTTVGATQTKIHGSSTATNNCPVTLDPPIMSVAPATVTATIATDAFPQPHKGQPITLSNTTATISVPGSVVQSGVDAGVLHDGDKIPTTVTLVVSGSSTTEGTHTYKQSGDATVHVVGGKAQPMVSTLSLPNTTWHPVNATSNVFFAEKSMVIVSTLTVPGLGPVTATLNCTPTNAPSFVAVAAQGTSVPVGTSGGTGATGTAGSSGAGAVSPTAATSPASTSSLPFTGGNSVVLLLIAAGCLGLGFAVRRGFKGSPIGH